jgi:hypothetical protein
VILEQLEVIHSGASGSLKKIKGFLEKLKTGEIDGIICVDMLGEGFDFPHLKIAAIHAPHKSLAVTLQFIGRFARTSGTKIGRAKFLAIPSEIEIEGEKLYEEDAAWQDIVINLSETRIEEEVRFNDDLNSFEQTTESLFDYRDISLHALRPYFHVKIYRVDADTNIDLAKPIYPFSALQVVRSEFSKNLNSIIFMTREVQLPRWTHIEALARIEHDLFIVHYNTETRLLFISASRKSITLYENIATLFTGGNHSSLPMSKISSVLATLKNFEFFNLGMRRNALHPNDETYRIMAGPSAQNAVDSTDGVMYRRGHVFCSAEDRDDQRVNLGYSSAGKVWSNQSNRIPGLVDWIVILADRIATYSNFSTGSGIDYLSVGEEIEEIPDHVIAAHWHIDTYQKARNLIGLSENSIQLMDIDLSVEHQNTAQGAVLLKLSIDSAEIKLRYSLYKGRSLFECVSEHPQDLFVTVRNDNVPLLEYMRDYPPTLFLSNFSSISGCDLSKSHEILSPFLPEQIKSVDWDAAGVDISREFTMPNQNKHGRKSKLSIHDYLMKQLANEGDQIVFYDHRSGEMADFITLNLTDDTESLTVRPA